MVGLLLGIGGGLLIGGVLHRHHMRRACRHSPWGLLRALELDGDQREQLRDLFHEVRRSARGLRQRDDWRRLVDVLASPRFDRAKAESVAAEKQAAFERLKAQILSALEQAHAVLRPEQRARLADWFGVGFAPAGGPYR